MNPVSLGIITVASSGTPVSIGSVLATTVGTEVGPFAIVLNTNDKILVSVDGGANQTVTLTAGPARTAAQVVSDINGQTTGLTASAPGGKIQISSNTSGSASSILLSTIVNSALTTLGLIVGTYHGLSGQRCSKIRLTPLKDNSGSIYVGNKANFDKTSGDGLLDQLMKPLATPSTLDMFVVETQSDVNALHTEHYFIDADNANDGVIAAIWVL